MAKWNHQKWGTLSDPIHKSCLSGLIGDYGCTRQYQLARQAQAEGDTRHRDRIDGRQAMGTAAHETIRRALRHDETRADILSGHWSAAKVDVSKVVHQEYQHATEGLEVVWFKGSFDASFAEVCAMVSGLLSDLHRHVASIELAEAGFIAPLGDYWLEGHVDLIYRTHSGALGKTDWKTGKAKPHQITLDYGWESGIYSAAMKHGAFVPEDVVEAVRNREGHVNLPGAEYHAVLDAPDHRRAMHVLLRYVGRLLKDDQPLPDWVVRFDAFPEEIHLTYLQDYVPYTRKGKKAASRPEEMAFYGLDEPGQVSYEKGDPRGPAWYRARRREGDIPQLEHLIRAVAGWVRFGRFVPAIGEKCTRCAFKDRCLTDGHEVDVRRQADTARALRQLPEFDDGLASLG